MKPHQLCNMQRWRLYGCFGSTIFALGALRWLVDAEFVSAGTRKAANDVVGKLELLAASIQDDITNKTWKTHTKKE